jgi:tellurite resistance protein TerC
MPTSTLPDFPASTTIWVGFSAYVVALLLLDLLVFNRKAHKIEWREAARLSAFFVGAALLVNVFVWVWSAQVNPPAVAIDHAFTFLTGYLVEVSLSVDNLFVIAVLFGYFGVPASYQHRVLFWGIFGAILMRAVMIFLGVALVARFDWLLYLFGAFLLLTGARMLFQSENAEEPGDNRMLRFLRRVLPVTKKYHGSQFFVREMGRRMVTPLFLVLVMVELTDVVFAVDSIPAILAITTDPFLAYASNIMAVAGLRALFFLLVGVIERVRYLHVGLGLVLVFIGIKMLAKDVYHLEPEWSLLVIGTLIGGAGVASWVASKNEQRKYGGLPLPPPGVPDDAPNAADAPEGTEVPGSDGAAHRGVAHPERR